MDHAAVLVFDAHAPATVLEQKGSEAWKLKPARARLCDYLVCVQNRKKPEPHGRSRAQHGEAFMVAKLAGVEEVQTPEGIRYRLRISEYAPIARSDIWDGGRAVVRYTTLEKLGINIEQLKFEPVPEGEDYCDSDAVEESNQSSPREAARGISITEAKDGLSLRYEVKPEQIEIIFRH